MGYKDDDKDGVQVWDGKGTDVRDKTTQDQNDNDPAVGAAVVTGNANPNTDAGYLASQQYQASLTLPSVSVSSKAETTADINAAFQAAFGENAPEAIVKAYYNDIHALQMGRQTGGIKPGAKVNVNTQGVSATEIQAVMQKYVGAAVADKLNAAQSGDLKGIAALQRGNLGVVYTKLTQAYQDNGIPVNAKAMGKLVAESVANPDKLQANLNLVNLQAKSFFPALADKIDAGYSVKQLLNPYLQTRANILEEDPDTIDIKGLQSVAKDPKGLMNLYDYEVSLRNDPKWRFTKNAQDSMASVAKGIAQMFGLVG